MPDEVDAFVAALQSALTKYRQHEAEDHRRRSARDELLHSAMVRHPELAGGAELTWETFCPWAQTSPYEELSSILGATASERQQLRPACRAHDHGRALETEAIRRACKYKQVDPHRRPSGGRCGRYLGRGPRPALAPCDGRGTSQQPQRQAAVRTAGPLRPREGGRRVTRECAAAVLGLGEASQRTAEQHPGRIVQTALLLHG